MSEDIFQLWALAGCDVNMEVFEALSLLWTFTTVSVVIPLFYLIIQAALSQVPWKKQQVLTFWNDRRLLEGLRNYR